MKHTERTNINLRNQVNGDQSNTASHMTI